MAKDFTNQLLINLIGTVVAERLRPLTSIPEVPGSNPGPAVAPLGKALHPHCLVFRRRLSAVGPVYRRVTPYARTRTHFTSRKEQGAILVKWSDSTNRQLYLGGEAYGSQILTLTFRHPGRPGDCQIE